MKNSRIDSYIRPSFMPVLAALGLGCLSLPFLFVEGAPVIPPPSSLTVNASTNGVLVAPLNFFSTNNVVQTSVGLQADIPANGHVLSGTFPVFEIALGTNFTDFVLKGSRSDYITTPLNFWYVSADPAKAAFPSQVWPGNIKPLVFYTDTGNSDPRVWLKQGSTLSISGEVAARNPSAHGTVSGAVVVVPATNSDISVQNGNLVWSYSRATSSAFEKDSTGRVIWHPITPKWISKVINPTATNY